MTEIAPQQSGWNKIHADIQEISRIANSKTNLDEQAIKALLDKLDHDLDEVHIDENLEFFAKTEHELNEDLEVRIMEAVSILQKKQRQEELKKPREQLWKDINGILDHVKREIIASRQAREAQITGQPPRIKKTRKKVDPTSKTE